MSEKILETIPLSINNLPHKDQNSRRSASEKSEVNKLKIQDVDKLSYDDLRRSISRVREDSVEPFTFLSKIPDDVEAHVPTDTEIDFQLAALSQRIQLNKSLLEMTTNRIKRINSTEGVPGADRVGDLTASPELSKIIEAFDASLSTVAKVKEIISRTSEALHQD